MREITFRRYWLSEFFSSGGFPQRTLFLTNYKLQLCELTLDRQLHAAFKCPWFVSCVIDVNRTFSI